MQLCRGLEPPQLHRHRLVLCPRLLLLRQWLARHRQGPEAAQQLKGRNLAEVILPGDLRGRVQGVIYKWLGHRPGELPNQAA